MEQLIQKLSRILLQQFPDSSLDLEAAGAGRLGGFLIWEGFTDLEQIQRQRSVWKILRRELLPEEQLKISAILTMTPEEMASARQG